VAEHDGTIIGMINLWNGKTRRTAHVGMFGIGLDHDWRGVGLGSLLLDRLLQWAEQEPLIEKVALGVFSHNEWAMRLYKKFGFIEEGRKHREIKFGPGWYADDVVMYKWVKNEKD
jgi:RimJ/RimL family protein N-acetyltransferase